MARAGIKHWRRPAMLMAIVMFVVGLMGGVLVAVVGAGGSLAVAAASTGSGSSGANAAKLTSAVKAKAEQDLLQPTDFPAGWVVGASAAGTSRTSPWSKQLASCSGVPSALAAIKPTKISGSEYTSTDHTLAVEDNISVYPTAALAKAAWKAMASPKTPTCMNRIGSTALRTSVQDEAGAGATVGSVGIAALAPGTYEAGQTGYSVTIPLVSGGRQLTITSTEIEFVRGRFDHQLTFNGNGVTFPPLLEVHLVRQVEGRA